MKNIRYSYIISILFIISQHTYSTLWQRQTFNYEKSTYHAGFQNWKIDQSADGWIYIANSEGLLEYDGVYWNLYPMKGKIVRSMKIDDARIYVGGSSEFGYFKSGINGTLKYKSISESLKNWSGEVWNIFTTTDNVYFVDEWNIYIYNKKGDSLKTIHSEIKIDCASLLHHTIYIGTRKGIQYLDQEFSFKNLNSSTEIQNKKFVKLLDYNQHILAVTSRSGIISVGTNFVKYENFVTDEFIKNNQLFDALIYENKIILGSVQNGAFYIDLENRSDVETYNINTGLITNTILSSFIDKDKNLWLGLDNGISCVSLNSPIRPLFAKTSPIGTGYCSATYKNELYLGTNQGLYKSDASGKYRLIKNSEGQIWSLLIYDDLLFCIGDNRILVISPTGNYPINLRGVWQLQPSSANKNKLIAGLYSGMAILTKENNRWMLSHTVSGVNKSCRGIMEDDVSNNFWVADIDQNLQKITLSEDLREVIKTKSYFTNSKLIDSNIFIRKIDNAFVVCTRKGIYQYNRLADKFIPYPELESIMEGQVYYKFFFIDSIKNIWYITNKDLKLLPFDGRKYQSTIYNVGLANNLVNDSPDINISDADNAIISVDNAFVQIVLNNLQPVSVPNTYIRKLINTRNDSVITSSATAYKNLTIPYSQNSFCIYYAGTSFSNSDKILYSYRLNRQDNWSNPTTQTFKEYTNLHEGKYTFEIKSFVKGQEKAAKIASVIFIISPPWYRTIWAYTVYIFLSGIILYLLYKQIVGKQKKMIKQKQDELKLQTLLYEKERKFKDHEIYILQNEKLTTELQTRYQEISGYILSMIHKNEILENVKRNVEGISKAIDEKKELSYIKQKTVKLVSSINNNLVHDADFDTFKSNFDLVHHKFFRQLDEKFPQLTQNDKILCAFLKMNLSSKEIAPMLGISVKGVEVNRYRLRKKMNLERDTNLNDFLQNFS